MHRAIAAGLKSIEECAHWQQGQATVGCHLRGLFPPLLQPSVLSEKLEISSLVNLNSGHTSNNRKGQLTGYYNKLVIDGKVVHDPTRTEQLIIRIACEHAGWEFV